MTDLIKPEKQVAEGELVRKSPVWFRGTYRGTENNWYFGDQEGKKVVGFVVRVPGIAYSNGEPHFKGTFLNHACYFVQESTEVTRVTAGFSSLEAAKAWVQSSWENAQIPLPTREEIERDRRERDEQNRREGKMESM